MGENEEGVFREEENYTESCIRVNTHREEHGGRKIEADNMGQRPLVEIIPSQINRPRNRKVAPPPKADMHGARETGTSEDYRVGRERE